jgi:D-alanine transaminase
MDVLANWNGQEMPLSEVQVPALDRSFLFGDGVYEVIRIYSGRPWRLSEHLERLAKSLAAMNIDFAVSTAGERLFTTLKSSGLKEALAYVQVTRGAAQRTHHFPEIVKPNCLVWVEPISDRYHDFRSNGAKAITYPDIRWKRNDIKCTSLAANCMAAEAARAAGCLESIFVDELGYMTEGSHSSIFGVQHGRVLVTPSSVAVLPGITKRQLIELCRVASIELEETRVTKQALFALDELFLTATPEEIIGIVEVDGQRIGSGTPGPVTRSLQHAFSATIEAWLATC